MKDKALVELIIVLILVGFGLWILKKDSAPDMNDSKVDNQEAVSPELIQK